MKKYAVREPIPEHIHKELNAHPELTRELLYYRGIKSSLAAEEFLNPNYDLHTHDPFLIKGMEKAVKRILKAIKKDEHIVIYSDYDCDGIPGGVILHDFFKKIEYKNFANYIPHRHEEGYGVNVAAIEKISEEDTKLIITVDCGITDVTAVKRANELGIDVIVTDHHLPQEILPPAYAILNSKQKDDSYPDDQLCGSGVAFKLVQALLGKGRFNIVPGWEKWLLDMAGLATIADMVPLRGENRVLAHFGLTVLRKSRRPGVQKLCRKMKINQRNITEDDVGFMIAPRINAASRMDHPMDAFKLLSTNDEVEADVLSDYLNEINDKRKGVVGSMVKEIKKRINNLSEIQEVIVMGNPLWRPALLGLAANSLMEEYNRPVFLWGREGGQVIKGSCRSNGSVNVVEMMSSTGELFIDAGGHKFSGGFSVEHEKIHLLEESLIKAYKKVANGNGGEEKIIVDKRLSLDEVTWETYGTLEKLAPFGDGNPKPIFLFEDVEIIDVKQFGKEKNHLELSFKNFDNKKIPAIGFFLTLDSFSRDISKGERVNLLASIEKSTFRNFPELRLRIVDIY